MSSSKLRYLPHTLEVRYKACLMLRGGDDTEFICRKLKISKSSLCRWNKIFDGTKESLIDKSKRPKTIDKKSHTEEEIKHIKNFLRRNPKIAILELYHRLRSCKGYKRHISSLYRIVRKLGLRVSEVKRKNKYIPKNYDTPCMFGEKMQMDVKFVPKKCYSGMYIKSFCQYTIIDEATRQRYLYAYEEYSARNTVDFLKRAIRYFGYKPKVIQTDNGSEFTYTRSTNKIHPLDKFCILNNIEHKCIRPRTPRHNGKVERSHRNDNERFYSKLTFYSLADLRIQMREYLRYSNSLPMRPLNWISPIEKRMELMGKVK